MRLFNPRTMAVQANFNNSGTGNNNAQITTEQYRDMRSQIQLLGLHLDNLRTRFEFCNNQTMSLWTRLHFNFDYACGEGVIELTDAAEGAVFIEVNPELSGQTLYVQLLNNAGFTDTQAEVSEAGVVPVELSTDEGMNVLYITTQSYAFPPIDENTHNSLTNGVYVNLHTDENGLTAFDSIRLTYGVFASVRYVRDVVASDFSRQQIPNKKILAALGKGIRYLVTNTPETAAASGQALYMKKDGYPYGTLANPVYVRTSYPNPNCRVYYIAETYDLN